MYVLFDNVLMDTVITAIGEDANYPADNLKSAFLRKRYQSVATSDTITITFATLTAINSVYYAYTNADTIEVRLYDGATLLNTLTGSDRYHFASVDVDKVEIDLSGTDTVYLGGIGIGLDYQIDPPESFWAEDFDDRSIVSESDAGQVLQEYVEPLRVYDFTIPTLDRMEARALQTEYVKTGIGRTLWVDPDTDDLPMLYSTLTGAVVVQKNKRQYTANMSFREAR